MESARKCVRWEMGSPLCVRSPVSSFTAGAFSDGKSRSKAFSSRVLSTARLVLVFILLVFFLSTLCATIGVPKIDLSEPVVLMRRGDRRLVVKYTPNSADDAATRAIVDPVADLSHPRLAKRRVLMRYLNEDQ
ncbi:unnamed protein product [Closterium sp. Naga37s-1]|nr:unnamed protein product [Closterium sp. Naga37s-1]